MNTDKFTAAYKESRNGTNFFVRHALARRFIYSDGVQECADAGCHWLLDILGTELPAEFKKRVGERMCVVKVTAMDGKADIVGSFYDDDPNPYRRAIDFTDLPDGTWTFLVRFEGEQYACILPTEY